MPLQMEAIWLESELLDEEQRCNTTRGIGELLPWVLARYSIEIQPTPRPDMMRQSGDRIPRLANV